MARPARVVDVVHLGDRRLRVTFSDGLVRELDFEGALEGDVFAPLASIEAFAAAAVDDVAGTVCWPGGIDLDPDVLHGDYPPASGHAPIVVSEYRLRHAG